MRHLSERRAYQLHGRTAAAGGLGWRLRAQVHGGFAGGGVTRKGGDGVGAERARVHVFDRLVQCKRH